MKKNINQFVFSSEGSCDWLVGWLFMVFNVTFNKISELYGGGQLLVEETGVPWENHQPATSHWQTLSHNVVLSKHRLKGIQTHNISGDRHWLDR